MSSIKEKVYDFLKKYEMDSARVNLEENCELFIQEMQAGLDSADSSLKMIPTYISMDKEVPINEPVIVMDAGGTNFRVAVVHFDESKKPVIEDFKLYAMPGTKGEITKEEFFNTIVEYVKPVLDRSNKISFCFSYPTEILPNKDGRLMRFSKEVKVKGVDGELIGENLLKAISEHGFKGEKSIILLNDTVATLLGGKAAFPDRIFDSYMGFILGTGTNTCYIEENSRIGKIKGTSDPEGSMLINMESGAYNKMSRGKIDLEFDSKTVNPGDYAFEKTVSGAYQGGLMLAVIRKAAEEGLFTPEFNSKLSEVKELSSKEIDDFLFYPYGDNALALCCSEAEGEEDRLVMYHLIDEVFERAAKFVTFNLAAAIVKTGKGTNPCAPVCVTADGSTFYKSKLFKGKLDHYVKTYLNEEKQLFCEFVKAENGVLIGTAIAGLVN